MSEIKRYETDDASEGPIEDERGIFVLYADHAATIASLQQQLADARRLAFEECAKIAKTFREDDSEMNWCGSRIAEAINAAENQEGRDEAAKTN